MKTSPWSRALLPLSVAAPNVANFLLIMAVAALLPATAFATFSLMWGIAQFIAVVAYEWLRLATIRYSPGKEAGIGLTKNYPILFLYRAMILGGLCVAIVSSLIPGIGIGTFGIFFFATANSAFEGRQAYFRATQQNKRYISSSLVRTAMSMISTIGAAWVTKDGMATLIGLGFSSLIPLLFSSKAEMKSAFRKDRADLQSVTELAKYGSGLALSGIVSVATVSLTRAFIFEGSHPQKAAALLLVLEISQKITQGMGMSLNLLLFPSAAQAVGRGAEEFNNVIGYQIALVAAAMMPATIGLILITPSLAWVFPGKFIQSSPDSIFIILALGFIAFRNFSSDVVFALIGNVRPVCYGPIIGLLINATVAYAGAAYLNAPETSSALAFFIGSAVAMLISLVFSRQRTRWKIYTRTMFGTAIATTALSTLGLLVNVRTGPLSLAAIICLGVIVYAAVLISFDAFQMRTMLVKKLRAN
ncbi:hypothetical protein [Bradyrhizobium sp. 199]|uniref:hypothetical protein n=1 Tax=Bradyrhizobium sp. 199 TaxID=2782664 RepID=UPI001FF75C82|nr:hypothetical protein [Bradyrhizobium sp. 199]MCK1362224.1 hypothetical protein [Bradyrhizobium sp. 199]